MKSLHAVFAADIEVIYREDHTPTFNGWITVDAALMEKNELYQQLSFVDRMEISSNVMNLICPLAEELPVAQPSSGGFVPDGPNSYIYTYDWDQLHEDYTVMVFDAASGNIVFDEWFQVLKKHDVMGDVEDVHGLMHFLIAHGELLQGDKMSFQFKGNTKGKDGGSLEA